MSFFFFFEFLVFSFLLKFLGGGGREGFGWLGSVMGFGGLVGGRKKMEARGGGVGRG